MTATDTAESGRRQSARDVGTRPDPLGTRRPRTHGARSIAMILASLASSVVISASTDVVLAAQPTAPLTQILISAVLFNVTVLLQSVVGGIIEWQRPGHTIGRLLMLSGPLYAFLAAGWQGGEGLSRIVDPGVYQVFSWATSVFSWPGMALIAGWVPFLFPTGNLPGPRWRIPAGILIVVSAVGLVALAVRPGPLNDGTGLGSPIAVTGWPGFLQVFVDAIPFELVALVAMAVLALFARYRRGDQVERLQIRWFGAAVAICLVGFAGTVVQFATRTGDGPLFMAIVAYLGILAMPITIGIAVTRYRLYDLDRVISRTIAWAVVTGILVAGFAGLVVGLQALLAGITQGQTLAVAASTLAVFALFQPLRRRVQSLVDRRFDRTRYDGERTATAFAGRLRDQIELAGLEADVTRTVGLALQPGSTRLWIRARLPRPQG